MSNSVSLTNAIEIVRKATEEDHKGNYREAYTLYRNALEYFMIFLKFEKDSPLREPLQKRFVEYLNRAEKLKDYLNDESKKKQAVGANGSTKK
ncbi:unnamed protein product [Cunninghamella echinulata]